MGKKKSYKNRKKKGVRNGFTPLSRTQLKTKPKPKIPEITPFSGFPQIEPLELKSNYSSVMRGIKNVFEPSDALERAVGLTLVNTLLAVPENIYEPKKEHPRNERLYTTAQLETYKGSIRALELKFDRSWKMSGSNNFIELKELELKGFKNIDYARTFNLESAVANDFYQNQGEYDLVFLDKPEELKFDYDFLTNSIAETILEKHQDQISELEGRITVIPTDKKIETFETFMGLVEDAEDYDTLVTIVTEYLGKTEMDEESKEAFTNFWDDYKFKETLNQELKTEILKKVEEDNLPKNVSQVVEKFAPNVAENGILIIRDYQEFCPGFKLIETYFCKDDSISLYQREDSSHN